MTSISRHRRTFTMVAFPKCRDSYTQFLVSGSPPRRRVAHQRSDRRGAGWTSEQFLSVVLLIPLVSAALAAVLIVLASGADPKTRALLLGCPLGVAILMNEQVSRARWTRTRRVTIRVMLAIAVIVLSAIVLAQSQRYYMQASTVAPRPLLFLSQQGSLGPEKVQRPTVRFFDRATIDRGRLPAS